MNFIKKLSFGKKSGTAEKSPLHSEESAASEELDFHDGDVINESVAESIVLAQDHGTHEAHAAHSEREDQPTQMNDQFHDEASAHQKHASVENSQYDHVDHEDSIGGSSTDMSPESIVSTRHDSDIPDVELPQNIGFAAKMKSMFSSSKNADAEPENIYQDNQLGENVESGDRFNAVIKKIGAQPRPLPIIGKMASKAQYGFALSLMTVSLLAAGYLSITSLLSQSQLKEQSNVVIGTQFSTQSLTLTAQNLVVRSDPASAGTLGNERNALKDASTKISKDSGNKYAISMVKSIENDVLPIIDRALKIAAEIGTVGRQVSILERNTSALYSASEQLSVYLQSTLGSQLNIAAADDMRVRAERMKGNGIKLLTGNSLSLTPLAEFGADVTEMGKSIAVLSEENSGLDETSRKFLMEISDSSGAVNAVNIFLQKYAASIVQSRGEVVRMRDAVGLITLTGTTYVKELAAKSDDYAGQIYLALGFLGLGVIALGLLSLINSRITKIEVWSTEYKNESNELDIIEFMGEIGSLEMRNDLTTSFTSNTGALEGITGGIRSSVNEAVISLREAMSTVKSTTGSVISNVSESVERSRELQNSNSRQFKEIEGVVNRVVVLSATIQEVTDNTVRAAHITSSAKIASDAGAFVVGQTNEKMSEIRNNMQDVLKSVKSLGDTSHEIGLIVEAIENITDRTQVIAVNASLEAAKAGAAGQGFQVLAGEVNRLAEQSNEALRTIIALVQRIQGETAATIRVVEESTNNVVEGAKLSESANAELSKISILSEQLQGVMNSIREQSENQSANAGGVRESMDRLNELSGEVQATVSQMVSGVQQIDASMGMLQSTVSIFITEKVEQEEESSYAA